MQKQKTKRLPLTRLLLPLALFAIMLVTSFVTVLNRNNHAVAATNSTINFQARLLTASGSIVPDGMYNVEFKLYNASSSAGSSQGSCAGDSACVWTETRVTTNKVRVANGYLTVNLGSVTSFASTINWDQEHWLTMNIGGTGSPGWDGEMTPRLKLTAVPYAFKAGQLVTQNGSATSTLAFTAPSANRTINLPDASGTICLQSAAACGFLTGSTSDYIQNTSTPQTANFNITGNGTVGSNLTANGNALFKAGTDSTTAFQVQNSGGGQVLVVDTINNFVRLVTGTITNITTASGTGAVQIGADNTDNLAIDDNEIMARSNGSASNLYLQKLGGGLNIQANNTIVKPGSNSSTTFQVQNSSTAAIFGVDTSGSSIQLGQGSSVAGKMILHNATNNNTITIQSGVTTTGYTLTMPTALGANGDCLKDTTGTGVLGFGACGTGGGGGGGTMQNSYDNSGTANPQITLSATNGGIKIQDASGGVSGNLFQIQNSAGTATYFGLSATALTLQDTSGNNAFVFDTSTSHLRIYSDSANPTLYADIYYDAAAGEAVFTASSGTTRIGSGSGDITLQLSAAADVLQATKTVTLGAAYSSNDFSFTRNITAGANALTGSVVKIESTATGSGTLASNVLLLNENNNSATGNLLLATKGGSDKFKVDVNGSITIASGQTLSSGSGALGLSAGSGNLTLTAGGANTVVAKPGTNSTASFQVQNASSGALFTADTSNNRLQVGSSSTDSTGVVLILDSYNQSGDPTGVNGAMYYNTSTSNFRCYNSGAWQNCVGGLISSNTAASTAINTCTTACPSFDNGRVSIPANYLQPGRVIHIVARGTWSDTGTPTFGAWGVYFGSNATTKTSDTLIGGATPTSAALGSSQSNKQWIVDYTIVCYTSGASGTINGHGTLTYVSSATTTASEIILPMSSNTTTTIDTTASQTLYLFPAWSASSASNTLTAQQFFVTGM